MLEALADNLNF